jgi:hypothetical protein
MLVAPPPGFDADTVENGEGPLGHPLGIEGMFGVPPGAPPELPPPHRVAQQSPDGSGQRPRVC